MGWPNGVQFDGGQPFGPGQQRSGPPPPMYGGQPQSQTQLHQYPSFTGGSMRPLVGPMTTPTMSHKTTPGGPMDTNSMQNGATPGPPPNIMGPPPVPPPPAMHTPTTNPNASPPIPAKGAKGNASARKTPAMVSKDIVPTSPVKEKKEGPEKTTGKRKAGAGAGDDSGSAAPPAKRANRQRKASKAGGS